MKISTPSQTLRIAKTNLNRIGQSHLIALAVAIALALFTPAEKSSAQIVTNTYPQSMLYTMPSLYAAPTTVEDVITNCDMLEDPSGDIKAAAWSSMNVSLTFPGSNMCQFMVEDYMGNQVIQNINSGGVTGATQPDIVLANDIDPITGNPGYQVLVVYVVPNSLSSYVDGTAYLDIYDITNIGTPSIGVSLRSTTVLSLNCNGYPHIDMWSDANNLTNGLPTMTDFAVVWAETTSADLMGWFGKVSSPGPAATPLATAFNHYMPDVACVTTNDPQGGSVVKQIELTYGNGVNDITIRTIIASGVYHEQMTETVGGGWSTPGRTLLASYRPFAPRIEAMSQYMAGSGDAKWQIAVTNLSATSTVDGFNSLTTSSLSNYTYSAPYGGWSYQAACVAAGVGPFLNSSSIGNKQYTAGYYPWGTPYNYSRDISVTTGNIITAAPFVINTTSPLQKVNYWWDVNQSLSLSNCSNSGKDLYAVWADTFGIVSKHSTTNTGTTWRVVKPGARANTGVYPNPASNTIAIAHYEKYTGYAIVDALGRTIQESNANIPPIVDVSRLPSGFYVFRATHEDGKTSVYKFTKE